MKMTREEQAQLMETAQIRHAKLVTRLLAVPVVRAVAHKPMAPAKRSKTVRAKAAIPAPVALEA